MDQKQLRSASELPIEYWLLRTDGLKTDSDYALYDKAFAFWDAFWREIFKQNGSDSVPDPDAFCRQNAISLILSKGEVIAMHCYSFFDLKRAAARRHSYFREQYGEWMFQSMDAKRARLVMSMEYFSLVPSWRSVGSNLPLSRVLAGLGFQFAKREGVDAVVGLARTDVPTAKIAYEFGATALARDIIRHNTPCDAIVFFPPAPLEHPDPIIADLVKRLWAERHEIGTIDSRTKVWEAA